MPAWPLGDTYTKGVLGIDQRTTVEASLAEAQAERQDWAGAIEARSYDDIRSDEALMRVVRESGRTLFGDNCAACHGRDAQGGKGFPRLADGSWLWGGDPDTVAETIRVGINSAHPETRTSQMLAFGRDQMLGRDEIRNVVSYVRSLSQPGVAEARPEEVAAGAETFAANCSGCHGEDAKGTPETGRSEPDRRLLDLRGRRGHGVPDGLRGAAGAHADLGGQAVAARYQDPHPLRARSRRERARFPRDRQPVAEEAT